jgi:hypothetical protein
MKGSTSLLMTGQVPLEPLVQQEVNHQLGVAHMAASVTRVGVKWGQEHEKQVARHVAST